MLRTPIRRLPSPPATLTCSLRRRSFFTFPEVPADKIAFFALDGEYHSDERVIIFDAKNGVRSGTVGKRGPKAGHGGRKRRKIDDVKEATVIGANNAL